MPDSKLPQLMERLPQELFDRIYNLVFTVPALNHVVVTHNFRLPPQLRVSKTIRKEFAASYFRNSIFVFTERVYYEWLNSLKKVTFDKLSSVQIYHGCAREDDKAGFTTPLKARQWAINSFVDIMNYREIFPSYLFYGTLPTDPGQLKFFSGAVANFRPGPLHSDWVVKPSEGSTLFTRVAGV